MAKRKLRKVLVTGREAFHVFEDKNGKRVEEKITDEDYRTLGRKNAGQPTKRGHKWAHSFGRPVFSTPTGELEDFDYYDNGDTIVVKLPGMRTTSIPKDKIDAEEKVEVGTEVLQEIKQKWAWL